MKGPLAEMENITEPTELLHRPEQKAPKREPSAPLNRVADAQKYKIWRQIAECLSGSIAIAVATFVCFRLRLDFSMPICLYFLVIVLVSARSTFLSSIIVSIIAVGCLDYFFLIPTFSLELSKPADYVAFAAFFTTSLIITRLVSKVRELTNEKLERSKAYLSEAQRISHCGSFGWKVSTEEIFWSEETFRIFQFEPTIKPIVEVVLQRVHPEDRDFVKQTIEHATQNGMDFDIQHRLLMPDSSIKYVRVVAHAERRASRDIEFVGAVMDVTVIKESEEKIRRIINTVPAQIWSSGPDGRLDFISQRQLDYFGNGAEQGLEQDRGLYVHPGDFDRLHSDWQISVAEGKPFESEIRLKRFDGEYRWFLSRAFPLFDRTGQIQGWYGNDVDIDDRKRADALLAGEKQLLEMVAEGCSLPVVLDALCRLVEDAASGCYCSVLLIDPSGTMIQHGAAPSLPASFNESINGRPVNADSGPCAMAVYLNEQVIATDIATETRWEPYAWCPLALAHGIKACWSTPISSAGGKVIGAFAIYFREPKTPTQLHKNLIDQFTHIAGIAIERTQSAAALKRSEAFLAKAQYLSLSGSFSWSVATNEITLSEHYYRIFELDPSLPVTLEGVMARVHPEDVPPLIKIIDQARLTGSPFDYEHRLMMPDGSIKYINMVAHAAPDQDGLLEYIGAVQDVTQRRLAEQALSKARSELAHVSRVTTLGELAASIAHEVNQPLTAVINNANACLCILPDSASDLEEVRNALAEIIEDADRASAVIARVRQLAKKTPSDRALLYVKDVVADVLALARYESTNRNVTILADFADDLPLVLGDRVQLQQVLLNLVVNGMDAMNTVEESKRILTISVRSEIQDGKLKCLLIVKDAGTGFKVDEMNLIFEAFYTTKQEGMGMGLAISRSIIESHGGRLWAESKQGSGATFLFSLPAVEIRLNDRG
jgi:PAS domain S-box-containing protein